MNLLNRILTLTVILTLCSCSTTRLRMLENSGAIRTDISKDPKYDYSVLMEGVTQFGWNGNIKEDRINMIISMFGDRCQKIEIGDEVSAQLGSTENGKAIPTWAMKVKCLNENKSQK